MYKLVQNRTTFILDWIAFIKNDENKALNLLYKSYRNDIVKWLNNQYNIDSEFGIDIFQQSIIILYDNVISGKIKGITSNIKTYLIGICKNKAQEHLRSQKRKQKAQQQYDFLSYSNIQDNNIEEKYNLEKYINLTNKYLGIIGNPCKMILELFYYKQLNMDQITIKMGYKNINTTKNQKYKCIKRLQSMINEHIKVKDNYV